MSSAAALWTRYRGVAYKAANRHFLPGQSREDVEQEALVGLWVAARSFDASFGVSFPSWATLVVDRHLGTQVRMANRHKRAVLTDAFRVLDDVGSSHSTEDLVFARERVREFTREVAKLTAMERAAVVRCLDGLGPRDKSDDNALHRAKTKLKGQMSGW